MKTWKVLSLVFAVMLILAIPALAEECGHNWSDWHVYSEPTCTDKGMQQRVCLICGEVEWGEPIPAKGHETKAVTVPATCTTDGSETVTCTVCGATVSEKKIPALGHDWVDTSDEVEATCTEDGYVVIECSRCGEKSTRVTEKAKGHSWTLKSEKPATCENGGIRSFVCANDCGGTKTEDTPALGHLWREALRIDPTCTEDGSKTIWCVRAGDGNCFDTTSGKSKTQQTEVIPATGHKVDINAATTKNSATCTADGTYSGYCVNCKEWIADYAPSKALGHDLAPWKKDADGNEYAICRRCDLVILRNAPQTPVQPTETQAPEQQQPSTTPGGTTSGGTTNNNHSSNSSSTSSSGIEIPATGDSSINWAYAMFVASLAGLMVVVAKRRALQK